MQKETVPVTAIRLLRTEETLVTYPCHPIEENHT